LEEFVPPDRYVLRFFGKFSKIVNWKTHY